jgi:hypothetical protein
MNATQGPEAIDTPVAVNTASTDSKAQTTVPLPTQLHDESQFSSGAYVRIGLAYTDEGPQLLVNPKPQQKSQKQSNDRKISQDNAIVVPQEIATAFGLNGDVWWESYGVQLVGTPMVYNNENVLQELIQQGSNSITESSDTFHDVLTQSVTDDYTTFSNSNPTVVTRDDSTSSIIHRLPQSFSEFKSINQLNFTLLFDGDTLVVGLFSSEPELQLPSQSGSVLNSVTVSNASFPDAGRLEVRNAQGTQLGQTDTLSAGIYGNIEIPLYSPITESQKLIVGMTIDGKPVKLNDEFVVTHTRVAIDGDNTSIDKKLDVSDFLNAQSGWLYGKRQHPLSASPHESVTKNYIISEALQSISIPVSVESSNNDSWYQFPDEIGNALRAHKTYETAWIRLGNNTYISQLQPSSNLQLTSRCDPLFDE